LVIVSLSAFLANGGAAAVGCGCVEDRQTDDLVPFIAHDNVASVSSLSVAWLGFLKLT